MPTILEYATPLGLTAAVTPAAVLSVLLCACLLYCGCLCVRVGDAASYTSMVKHVFDPPSFRDREPLLPTAASIKSSFVSCRKTIGGILAALSILVGFGLNVLMLVARPGGERPDTDDPAVGGRPDYRWEVRYAWYADHTFAALLCLCCGLGEVAWPTKFMRRFRVLKFAVGRGAFYVAAGTLTLCSDEEVFYFRPALWFAEACYAVAGAGFVLAALEWLLEAGEYVPPSQTRLQRDERERRSRAARIVGNYQR